MMQLFSLNLNITYTRLSALACGMCFRDGINPGMNYFIKLSRLWPTRFGAWSNQNAAQFRNNNLVITASQTDGSFNKLYHARGAVIGRGWRNTSQFQSFLA